jgi:hydroxymethylbilane synthase
MLAAIPKRADARDVLITRGEDTKPEFPFEAIIATGSTRRSAQLGLIRRDLRTIDIRGNIDTRLKKFRENEEWYGLLLAAAGLERLKPDLTGLSVTVLPFEQMLPAPGQGALALQTRRDNADDIRNLVGVLHDPETAAAVSAERMFLHALGGGCREPIAAYAQAMPGELLKLEGIAWLIGETKARRGQLTRRIDKPETLGVDLAVEISR